MKLLLTAFAAGAVAAMLWLGVQTFVLHRPSPDSDEHRKLVSVLPDELLPAETINHDSVFAFCGDCHAVPSPENYPRARWADELKRGYEFYARSGRTDLSPPPPEQTLLYYLAHAPAVPSFETPGSESPESARIRFRPERRRLPPNLPLPEVSTLIWAPLQQGGRPMLIAGDMKYGQIVAIDPNDADAAPFLLARLDHPARIEPVDLSDDGSTEFLIADLGSYMPSEAPRGRVVLLRRPPGAAEFMTTVLAEGFTRAGDVRAADFDGDGKIDLLVAEFGWQTTGGIWLLRNVSESGNGFEFERIRIDDRPGTIHLPILDATGDGRPDFIALTSQEHETVNLYFNPRSTVGPLAPAADDRFRRLTLWAGPDLTFGAAGLNAVDLNENGRVDLLLTAGDAWDNLLAAPGHGVHLLENLGDYRFGHRRLASLPGAYSTTVFDANGNGRNDIIAAAWLPSNVEPLPAADGRLGSILCLAQTETGDFAEHVLETGSPYYSAVAGGDFNGNGAVDFAVASGPMVAQGRDDGVYLTIWWNESTSPD